VKASQERAALTAALRSTPLRLIAERSDLPPSQVRRLIRQLPRRKSA
jgi:DNA-binding IclR family transcriptional regulator